MIFCRQFLS